MSFLRRRGSSASGPLVSYRRQGGHPPPDRELLEVSPDGSFTMWRTIARAFDPPTPVGRFAGTIDPDTLERLRAATEDAERAGDLTEELPAGSAVEETAVGKRRATLPHTASPDGPWGQLLRRVRPLLVELTASPQAAVGLRLGDELRLVQLGAELAARSTSARSRCARSCGRATSSAATGDGRASSAPIRSKPARDGRSTFRSTMASTEPASSRRTST